MLLQKARKDVQNCRLNYDACKQRVKGAKPDKVEVLRHEMEKAEDEFVAAVEDAMNKMKAVVTSPQPLSNLADLVAAQVRLSGSVMTIFRRLTNPFFPSSSSLTSRKLTNRFRSFLPKLTSCRLLTKLSTSPSKFFLS